MLRRDELPRCANGDDARSGMSMLLLVPSKARNLCYRISISSYNITGASGKPDENSELDLYLRHRARPG